MSKFQKLLKGDITEIRSSLENTIKLHKVKDNSMVIFELSSNDHNFTSFFETNVSNEEKAILNIINEFRRLEEEKVETIVKNIRNSFLGN